jgi:type IX secretion system PorP/SprF family membrane protein
MKLKTIIFSIAFASMGYESQAQQLPESNLYTFNKYNINPAYTGFNDCLEIYGSHLSQWVGIDGAPSTNYFSAHSGIGKNMGLGGGIILDNAAFISRFSAKLSYAYRINFGEDHNLRFGLSAGLYQVKVDATSAIVDDVTDEVVSGGAQSGMSFNSDFGVFYSIKGFQFGISVPQVFETEAKLQFQNVDGFTEKRHYVGYAGYDYVINEKWNAEPSVLYKTAQSGLNQLDLNGMVTYNKLISVGVGYRTHVGILARLGLSIKDKFVLGYAYEFAGANISSYGSGSHEIMLGVKFCKEVKNDNKSSFETNETASGFSEEKVEKVEKLEEVVEEVTEKEIEETAKEETPDLVEEVKQEEKEEVGAELKDVKLVEEEVKEVSGEQLVEQEIVDNVEDKQEEVPVVVEEVKKDSKANIQSLLDELNITFPFNESHIDLSNNKQLNALVELLKEDPTSKITIAGHTCDMGNDEINNIISSQRAQEVFNYLIDKGVSKSQLSVKSFGARNPKYSNDTIENRAKNRRVEVTLD